MYMEIFLTSFFVILLIGACIGYLVAATRKGSWALKVKPQRMELVSTMISPEESLASIICFALASGYKISNLDEMANRVVLEESISIWSYGFFFPVLVTKHPDGYTLIKVGIKSKFIQYGPIVSRSHSRCVNGIKASLAEQIQFS